MRAVNLQMDNVKIKVIFVNREDNMAAIIINSLLEDALITSLFLTAQQSNHFIIVKNKVNPMKNNS